MTGTFYHNPRCSKSRQTLSLLEENAVDFKIKEYLKEGLEPDEVKALWDALGEEAKNLVRVKEDEFQADPFSIDNKDIVAQKVASLPKLLERPIVLIGGKAKIGRPPENVLELFK